MQILKVYKNISLGMTSNNTCYTNIYNKYIPIYSNFIKYIYEDTKILYSGLDVINIIRFLDNNNTAIKRLKSIYRVTKSLSNFVKNSMNLTNNVVIYFTSIPDIVYMSINGSIIVVNISLESIEYISITAVSDRTFRTFVDSPYTGVLYISDNNNIRIINTRLLNKYTELKNLICKYSVISVPTHFSTILADRDDISKLFRDNELVIPEFSVLTDKIYYINNMMNNNLYNSSDKTENISTIEEIEEDNISTQLDILSETIVESDNQEELMEDNLPF